jgi:hypothetical protein
MRRPLLTILLALALSFTGNGQTVYKTPSGEKYHTANCHTVKNVSEQLSVEEAVKLGLEPCKICKPAGSYSTPQTKKPQGEGTTVQCKGTTKVGTRCKHMTRIANGYCFQHQP